MKYPRHYNEISQYFTLPGLFHVESMEGGWTAEIPGGFHRMVDGFHGTVDGFHDFSTWIPYLFHMESSWNKFLESSIHTYALEFKLEWGLID